MRYGFPDFCQIIPTFQYANRQQVKGYLSGQNLYACLNRLKCPMGRKRLRCFGILQITIQRVYLKLN